MILRENCQEVHALFAHRRLVGGVGGVNAGEEGRIVGRFQRPGNGLEFGDGDGVSITVGQFGEAGEDSVLEVLGHFLPF